MTFNQILTMIHNACIETCINGGEYDESGMWQPNAKGLGMGKVLDYVGVDYRPANKRKKLF